MGRTLVGLGLALVLAPVWVPLVAWSEVESWRARRALLRGLEGERVVLWPVRRGWRELGANNVVPAAAGWGRVWFVEQGAEGDGLALRRIVGGVALPALVTVQRGRATARSLREELVPLKASAARDASTQAAVRAVLEAAGVRDAAGDPGRPAAGRP
ncbi:MAG: hypothetical protein H6732_09865 [Alphaproteobacteria bacterium]|nr:hypothetical protein [Alphaproteobacteria bacterium]